MKTSGKLRKNIGAAVLTLAAVTSISMAAFADEGKSVPMQKLVPSSATAVAGGLKQTDINSGNMTAVTITVPAAMLTEAVSPENAADIILTRKNESTGKLEISRDNGATWSEYDGKAIMLTPAVAAQRQ